MALPLYLALTAAEFQNCSSLPEHAAWMACHYSPYAPGLSNRPQSLPDGAMVILNDRTPPQGHDPVRIAGQLRELTESFPCGGVLLDFQRPALPENAAVARAVTAALPCPVGVSELYAKDLNCPVFLPPAPPHIPLKEYLSPWEGREIWLDAAPDCQVITVMEDGAAFVSASPPAGSALRDDDLFCHYTLEISDDRIIFTLYRNAEDLHDLLASAEELCITRAIGLWQELSRQESIFPTPRLQSPPGRDIIQSTNRFENT